MKNLRLLNKYLFTGISYCLLLFFCASQTYASATIEHDSIELQSLNKATAQTTTFEMKIGETVKIGPLYVRARACRTNAPTEQPESAGFLQIWTAREISEKTAEEEGSEAKITSEWVFSGWMFASSPGLSSLDHAIYDLWVLGCGENANDMGETLVIVDQDQSNQINGENADHSNLPAETPTEYEEEDAPVVIIDGEVISFPSTPPPSPEDQDPRFQAYDEEKSTPILHLE